MTARQQWIWVGAFIAVLAVVLFAATHFLGDELFPLAVGSKVPEFQAKTVTRTPSVKTLADYKGKVLLVNVWATWCEPCRIEMPSIQKLYDEFGPQGLSVVAISVDDAGTDLRIAQFAQTYGLTFEILHGEHDDIQRAFQTTGFPETFVIGRDGVIHKKVIGQADWTSEANRTLIRELLGPQTALR